MTIARRSFLTGLISLVAAPAIVRAGSLMPVRAMVIIEPRPIFTSSIGTYNGVIFHEIDIAWGRKWITRAEALEIWPDPHS